VLGSAVIGQGIIDLALVDEEGVFFVAASFGNGRRLATVEKDAAAEAFGRSSTVRKIECLSLNDLRKDKRALALHFVA